MEYGPPPLFRQGVSARIRFILFVFICVVLILVDGRLKSLDGFRSTVVSVTTPLVSLLSIPGEWLHHSEGYFVSKARLTSTVNELTLENKTLALENVRFRELQKENTELRQLLNAVPRFADKTVTAEVIGRVSDHFTRRIKINVGETVGVQMGMPVLSSQGVLGLISRVTARQAEGTLLTDHRQQISVRNERTGDFFVLHGNGDNLMDLKFVPPTSDILPGDRLITSGLDHVYPKDILVGTIKDTHFEAGETYKTVSVNPTYADHTLQFVVVILVNPNPTQELDEAEQQQVNNIKRRAGR